MFVHGEEMGEAKLGEKKRDTIVYTVFVFFIGFEINPNV
jgi:hypothetical protein